MHASADPRPRLDLPGRPLWLSAAGYPPPSHVREVDDRLSADAAHRLVQRHVGLLWRGDFHGARQLLAALSRRVDARAPHPPPDPLADLAATFRDLRRHRAHRARVLGMLLVPLDAGFAVALRRAPEVRDACLGAYQRVGEPSVVALRELLGVIGAHEWRVRGVEVPALDARIHPHYGVFAPTRDEYTDLVAAAPLPARTEALDIGTGTGVLAAILARRGVTRVLASDSEPRAVACARENVARLGFGDRVTVRRTDLYPPGRVPLVVCNPPWLPTRAHTPLERAVYDPDGRMLRGFLRGLPGHLTAGGEGWLILSDLAELLGLRPRDALPAMIDAAGLTVAGTTTGRSRHRAATGSEGASDDPLAAARAAEVVTLWRLAAR